MPRPAAPSSRAGRLAALLLALALGSLATTVPSCVAVLGAGDYRGAATSLCDLLAQCYGSDAYPGCVERVAAGLDGSDPSGRVEFLGAFSQRDCLRNCSTARACLDMLPVCEAAGAACGAVEECCGFTVNEGACSDGRCCLPDGQPCGAASVCCSGCDGATGTCGGEDPCAPPGAQCQNNDDCCSFNCAGGTCSFVCRQTGENCDGPGDCCTDRCVGGLCACRQSMEECEFADQCCSGFCNPSSSFCEESTCSGVLEECNGDCCPGTDCLGVCCYPSGTRCSSDPIFCCGGGCRNGSCCAVDSAPCASDPECCRGFCDPSSGSCQCVPDGAACKDDQDCCNQSCRDDACACNSPVCHAGCAPHPNPLPLDNSDCATVPPNAIDSMCVAQVCFNAPYCCCREWDQFCVDLVGMVCPGACPVAL
jgi:hypothetical protein